MLVSSLELWAALKLVVQLRPRRPPSITRASSATSTPEFFMLPMLVVRKFEKLLPAATGTVKMRSLVLLLYQSMEPLIR